MGLFDRLRGRDGPRVALIGIDGVPYQLIADHPDTFESLHQLIDAGSGGAIDSIVPPESSACWPSLTTGVNPGKTGVYGFQDREIGSYETYIPTGQDVQAKRVWDRVHEVERKATVLNVPVTVPPQRTIQRMVTGFLSTDLRRATHPSELAEELTELNYRIDVNATLGHEEDKSEFIADAHQTLDARTSAFLEYIGRNDWDLFVGVYMTTDRINHFLFGDYEQEGEYYEEFMEFYRTLDSHLGRIVESLPEDVTLLVASDHGFTTLDYEMHCNRWLQDNGWLSYKNDSPEQLSDIASETSVYSLIPGRFYVNLRDREPRGSVPPESYEATLTELERALESLTGPHGERVIDWTVRGTEAFFGPHADIAPDLVAIPADGFDLKAGFSGTGPIFDQGPRNGMHTFDHATLISDDASLTINEADILDITPTMLSAMDIDYDDEVFDGASLY